MTSDFYICFSVDKQMWLLDKATRTGWQGDLILEHTTK